MSIDADKIIECPLLKEEGTICYVTQQTPDIKYYNSLSTGFWTNSLMKEGEEFLEEQFEILPNLYKDLMVLDADTQLIWLPQHVNVEGKGTVFAYGKSTDDWQWGAMKSVPVKEEEKEKFQIPGKEDKYYEFKTDKESLKLFHRREFIDAMDYVDLLV